MVLATIALVVLVTTAWRRAELVAPPPTLLLVDRTGEPLGELLPPGIDDAELGYWALDELPERVVQAMVAIEDRRFHRHPGVDPLGVARALWQNLRHGERISGASTLAMQVARMQRPGPRTYPRKAVEALTALFLTSRWGRDEVLRHYLRIVPYSNRIHGIRYAARRYFDKPVDDLSWAEVAFLAAIPQSPARMSPFDPQGKSRAVRRGLRILDLLAADGVVQGAELAVARRQIRRLRIPPRLRRPDEVLHAVLRYDGLFGRPVNREPLEERPIVATTLDLGLQREVAWLAEKTLDRLRRDGAGNLAVLVVDRDGWRVRAAVSSAGYFSGGDAGAIDYLRVPRSAGSTLKPFLFGLALDRGLITPATIVDDLGRGAGGITNSDERFLGPLLPRVALANSRNVPAADLLATIGLDEGHAFFGALGLHDGSTPAGRYGLGLAIGGLPVTLEDLVAAYTVLAGDGRRHSLRWYEEQTLPPSRRLLGEGTARRIALYLADPQARLPSFPRLGWSEYRFPVAVKTGTSSRYRDAWTVAFSGRWLIGVWIGHPEYRPMRRVSGYRAAARLAQEVMTALHPDDLDGLADHSFPPPRGQRPARLCALTGGRAGPACDRVVGEWLAPGEEVIGECRAHRLLAVDRRDGLLATVATPIGERELRAFVELPPRYAAWSGTAGLPHPPSRPSPLADASPAARASRQAPSATVRRAAVLPSRLEVVSPPRGLRLLRDPETPPELATLALEVVADPPPRQLVWYVDGKPFATVGYPYTARWPLTPGDHTFHARVPFTDLRSSSVVVRVE